MGNYMNKVIICKYCGRPEYYGEMRWFNSRCMCRSCYKFEYEKEAREPYKWDDLEGERPSIRDLDHYFEDEIEFFFK